MKTLLAALALLFLAAAPIRAQDAPAQPGQNDLTIETAAGKRFHFTVELALTPEQQERGLMFRKSMAPDAGMLFVFDRAEQQVFWMKNTLIPLDMIFIAADGRIVNIHERAVPGSLDPIPSAGPVRGVLEVNGGTASRLGIKPGDRVLHPIFGNAG